MSTAIADKLSTIRTALPDVEYKPGEEPQAFLDEIRNQHVDGPQATDKFENGVDRTTFRKAVLDLYAYSRLPGSKEAFAAAAEMVNVAATKDFVGSLAELGSQYPSPPAVGLQELKEIHGGNRFNGLSTAYKDAMQTFVAQHSRPGTALEARLTQALTGNGEQPFWTGKVLKDLVNGEFSSVTRRNSIRLSAERGDAGPLSPSVLEKAEQWSSQTEKIGVGDPDPWSDMGPRRDPLPMKDLKAEITDAVNTWSDAMASVNSSIVYEGIENLMVSTGVVDAFEQDLMLHAFSVGSTSNPMGTANMFKEVAELKQQLDPIADGIHWDEGTRPVWAEAIDSVHTYLANRFESSLDSILSEATREPEFHPGNFSPRPKEKIAKAREQLREVWNNVRGTHLEHAASKAYEKARQLSALAS